MSTQKKLYKNKALGKVCGVCAGIAEYFDMDVTIIRILWVILCLCAGSGIIAYFAFALIMPDKSDIY